MSSHCLRSEISSSDSCCNGIALVCILPEEIDIAQQATYVLYSLNHVLFDYDDFTLEYICTIPSGEGSTFLYLFLS